MLVQSTQSKQLNGTKTDFFVMKTSEKINKEVSFQTPMRTCAELSHHIHLSTRMHQSVSDKIRRTCRLFIFGSVRYDFSSKLHS